MECLRPYLLALASALLFTLGLPNEHFLLGFPPLGYLALIPLYIALLEVPGWLSAALVTGVYGAFHHAASSYWLCFFQDFAFWTLGATTFAYFFVYTCFGLCLVFLMRRSGGMRPLAFGLLWATFEFLKSTGFLAYPWGLLPYTQSSFLPFLQIADTTGIYGLSFLLAFSNACLSEWLFRPGLRGIVANRDLESARPWRAVTKNSRSRPPQRQSQPKSLQLDQGLLSRLSAFALSLCLASLGYGLWRVATSFEERGEFHVLVVQQNLNPWTEGTLAALEANTSLMKQALAKTGEGPELVLFSESSLGYPFISEHSWYETHPASEPFLPYLRQQGLWLLTGSPVVLDWENFSATNSVILVDPAGMAVGEYAKIHPVPFAEAIPFFEFAGFRDFLKKAVGLEAGWTMGTKYTVFEMPSSLGKLRFGAPICFEDAFAPLCRRFVLEGADLLINLTDDSWSRTASAEYQHLAAARFRSIETRRSLVRSTNSGISAVIGPHGEIRDSLQPFVAAQMMVAVPIANRTNTAYLAFGDWFALLCLFVSAVWTLTIAVMDAGVRRRAK